MKKQCFMICTLAVLFLSAGFLTCLFIEKPEYSYSERRYLAAKPKLTADTVRSGRFMADFESYALDTFPFRERLRKIKAWTAVNVFHLQDHHRIYRFHGYLAVMEYPMHKELLKQAAEQFASICRRYLTEENHVYLSVIPDKNCFLAKESQRLSMDYEEFENQMRQETQFAEYIKISDLLEIGDYYKTDPHWRQEKITDIAKRLAEHMGAALEEDYTKHLLTRQFYGAYYGQSALSTSPDCLYYLTGTSIDQCKVFDWQNEKEISVYDMQKAAGKDPYEIYLSGPLSLLTIKNPKVSCTKNQKKNEKPKKLVIFRDSFGSSLAPLFISGYSQITLIDIRYIQPEVLGRFVDFKNCDILFLYSTLVLNNEI